MAQTTRSGRQTKPNSRYVVNDEPVVVARPPRAPRQPKQPVRTIVLDDIAGDDVYINPKLIKDYGQISYPYWQKHFFTPNDGTSKRYFEVVAKLADKLPAGFMDGIGALEIKPEFFKPPKEDPILYSKLIKGDYEIDSSKSDKNVASSINFFRRNLPSNFRRTFTIYI